MAYKPVVNATRRNFTSHVNVVTLHHVDERIALRRSISFCLTSTFDVQLHQGAVLPFHPSKAITCTWALDYPRNKPAMTNVMLFLSSSSRDGGTNKLITPRRHLNSKGYRLLRLFRGFPGDVAKSRDAQSLFIRIHRAFSCAPISFLISHQHCLKAMANNKVSSASIQY